MPKICYVEKRFSEESLAVIAKANEIIEEYAQAGFDLTLRQLYYQFVARGLIANRDSEYKRLGGIVNDARLAGLVDWTAITDRTRYLRSNSHWDDPADIIASAASSYAIDKWDDQPHRVEVWIEKDALVGVIEPVCTKLDVPFFSCRGYTSASEMWGAAQRLLRHIEGGQEIVILHLGDHDPSGKDMTRDIQERLSLFVGDSVEVQRLALNMDQVEEFDPPPNPAKVTDSRASAYIAEFGDESWELDALDPVVISGLIEDAILSLRDEDLWEAKESTEARGRQGLKMAARRWPSVEKYLTRGKEA
jgi:hypothetical protein